MNLNDPVFFVMVMSMCFVGAFSLVLALFEVVNKSKRNS